MLLKSCTLRPLFDTALPSRTSKGFSLFEMLIVIALMGLLSGLVVMNMGAVFAGVGDEPLPETLRRAVREARFQAASNKETATLTYDSEATAFIITGVNGNELARLKADADPDRDSIIFLQLLPEQGLGVPDQKNTATSETRSVAFHPDRSSTPFTAEVTYSGDRTRHRFDAFSNLQIREERW